MTATPTKVPVARGAATRLREGFGSALASPLATAERVSAVTQVLSSAEYLVRRQDRRRGGLNHWDNTRQQVPAKSRWAQRVRDVVARESVTTALHASRLVAGGLLVSGRGGDRLRAAADLYLAGTQVVLYPRHLYGTDGSDQVSFLVQSAAGIGRAGGSETTRRAAIEFIGAQTALSYCAAGVAKLPGADWRSGDALVKIMRTQTYGDEQFHALLRQHPELARMLCHAVLALEVGFPLLMLQKGRYIDAGLLAMGSFHVANARLMGLSRFAWAFVATYPALRSLARREAVAA